MWLQTCMTDFLLWKTKLDILKNVGNQTTLEPMKRQKYILRKVYVPQKKERNEGQ